MKRLLCSVLLAFALPLTAQKTAAGAKAGGSPIEPIVTYGSLPVPAACITAGMVPFFGSPVSGGLTCDAGLTYNATTDTLTTGTSVANVRTGTTSVSAQPAAINITNTTNATPIVVTATAHGLVTGDRISISGITGNTNANGYFKVTRLSADTFSLQNYSTGADIAGNGAHGGTPVAVAGIVQASAVVLGGDTGLWRGFAKNLYVGTGAANDYSGTIWAYDIKGLLGLTNNGSSQLYISTTGGTIYLSIPASATLQLGAANAASPVAQTLKVQDATGSNANAAASFTIQGPAGRGTGTPGAIVLQAAIGASSGSTAHTQTDALKIVGAASGGVPAVVLAATQSPASGAACTQWTIAVDANYIYVCTASGAWKRAALTGGY